MDRICRFFPCPQDIVYVLFLLLCARLSANAVLVSHSTPSLS
jgi:hypothetical protein